MFCSKCGSQIPDGNKFCSKCGTPANSNVVEAATSAAPATPAAPVTTVAPATPAAPAKKEKKSHTGLAVFLIVIFLIALLAIGAFAAWMFVVPESTKDYLKMEKSLKNGDYEKVLEYFDFSDEDLADDKEGFEEFAKENLQAGFAFDALFKGELKIKGVDGEDYTLAFDEDSKKFGGDQFTYSFVIKKPSIKDGKLGKDFDEEKIAGFLGDKSVKYKYNALLGDDETTATNNVEVEVEIKDGKLGNIKSITAEDSLHDASEFAHVDNNELVFDTLAVDKDYAMRVATRYGDFITNYTDAALSGRDRDDYMSEYSDYIYTDNYLDEYDDLTANSDMYEDIGYGRYIEASYVEDPELYHMGDTGYVITARYTGRIDTSYDYFDVDEDSYLLIRPDNSINQVVLNADRKEAIEEYNDLIDSGLSFYDAYTEIMSSYARDDENEIDLSKYMDFSDRLSDDEKDSYYDALMDFADEAYDYGEDPRFMMIDIGEYYPLMVCASGDYHASACKLYIYDGRKVVDLGYFGEYSSIGIYGNIVTWSGGNMGYYTTYYYEISGDEADTLLEVTEDSSGSKTKYYDKNGKTITEKEYNEKCDDAYDYACERAEELGLEPQYISYYDMDSADVRNSDYLFE